MIKKASQIAELFLLYRKLRKSEKIVYNELEIKNGMTKERRSYFATTLCMQFLFRFRVTALSDYIGRNVKLDLSRAHELSVLFK